MNRRDVSLSLLCALALGARAQPVPLVEGQTFERLRSAQPAPAAGKVEVIEFFSYACPHCNAFEPELEAWAARLPKDVVLRRVPVYFLANAENFQKTYYSLEALGLVATLQKKIFDAVHVEHLRLDRPEDIATIVAKHGGDAAKFLAAFKSFSVVTATTRATKTTADYGVDNGPGVPTLVVQGRWFTSPAQAGSNAAALAVVDELIQRARKG